MLTSIKNYVLILQVVVSSKYLILKLELYHFWKANEGKSAASFCHKVAAWVPDMFYLGKNHKIAKNLTAIKAREKISAT